MHHPAGRASRLGFTKGRSFKDNRPARIVKQIATRISGHGTDWCPAAASGSRPRPLWTEAGLTASARNPTPASTLRHSRQTFAFMAMILDCVDDEAKAFYQHYDFQELSGHPYRLFLTTKQLQAMMRKT
jgi:hypothetical protein